MINIFLKDRMITLLLRIPFLFYLAEADLRGNSKPSFWKKKNYRRKHKTGGHLYPLLKLIKKVKEKMSPYFLQPFLLFG